MSQTEFDRFRELVLDSPALQQRLRESPGDTEGFINLLIRVGAESGFTFCAADVNAVLQAAHLSWLQRGLPAWM